MFFPPLKTSLRRAFDLLTHIPVEVFSFFFPRGGIKKTDGGERFFKGGSCNRSAAKRDELRNELSDGFLEKKEGVAGGRRKVD